MSPKSKAILGAALAAAMIAVLGAAAAAASDRPIYVSVGATARAPIGWVEFCNESPKECAGPATQPRDVVLTPKAWKDLVRVNKWVNDTIKPMTDLEHWGVVEKWSYPDDGKGDCEDYVLLKRRMLIAGRLAARGAADHRGARQEGRRPRRAHGQDRQGRLHPRQPGRRTSCSGPKPATASSSASRRAIRISGFRSAIRGRRSSTAAASAR